ncbi:MULTISPECIES: ATP-binding protein [unclassified Mesorhizobium]|uniref:ATP-binding protein n=1 Tax=unclassified Mesorhizobium TaxID=325217 RepID=UPI000FC9E122|nr:MULTISPECIES: ATP-binding protein [unclassified Mesorhizobium]RUX97535.1 ATP-binding protein [Mesorhizobium sp. M7D.F.Ca.US.004.01.2.1]RVA33445.1 ATP-binding protein [Mesorhizobium sp. M7D.F.Ca.US.004.03.1.1]
MDETLIPFDVETSRIIELLAKQIYQSPFALLRENVQNAFDAIRERMQIDRNFHPRIDVSIEHDRIKIADNGIGMSRDELRRHFWTAGSSSKNNPEARAAGVVGTFGIGAMANFGIAKIVIVETESARASERTLSSAKRETLSLREDCVTMQRLEVIGQPGTVITAELMSPGSINLVEAKRYLREFVRLVDVPIFVNEELISQVPLEQAVPAIPTNYYERLEAVRVGPNLQATGDIAISGNAIMRLVLTDLFWNGQPLKGHLALRSGDGAIHTARSGFGLAMAPINSIYAFGGVIDMQVLQPTAGREALTSDGVQLLQSMMTEIDNFASERLSNTEQCNQSTPFMQWICSNGRYDLAGNLAIEVSGQEDVSLKDAVVLSSQRTVRLYGGSDPTVIKTFSSEDSFLLILSRNNPRRHCQEGYLGRHPVIEAIPDRPTVVNLQEGIDLTSSKWAVSYRLVSIISEDFFIDVEVAFGEISHGVAVVVDQSKRSGKTLVILNSTATAVITLLQVYETHLDAFRSLAKDFARNVIFPHISQIVPSSTRQGAEAFIEAMRRKRETFEYDSDELDELPSIMKDYHEGRITLETLIDKSKFAAQTSVQIVEGASPVRDVVPDLIENERAVQDPANPHTQWIAEPSILRTEIGSPAKLITIDPSEPDLRGYRCFIALAPRTFTEFGDFFTQPHSTSVVWGGQKALFIFIHHSGEFGVYYDMQTMDFVSESAGGGSHRTCTIMLRDRIYIPVPPSIQASFIPKPGEKKRFEIKADLIRTGAAKSM